MSIRYKFFFAFSIVVALASALAFYSARTITTTGDLTVRLYDGPLMGINYARSAHALLNEARLLLRTNSDNAAAGETAVKFRKLLAEISEDLGVVRDRVPAKEVASALGRAEALLDDWTDAVLQTLKPPPGGLPMVPASFAVEQKSQHAAQALDDLVETVAAYGFNHRADAAATVMTAQTTVLSLAIGTAVAGLLLAIGFSYSMSRPIFSAIAIAKRVAMGNFTDLIEVNRRDELGHLLNALATMQVKSSREWKKNAR
ncbi:hypothetical protein AJ87_19830 [Rhizobium yanglingense]|nr:hypothetical protein AJ87_19830 [Rhizobium yanglingense]